MGSSSRSVRVWNAACSACAVVLLLVGCDDEPTGDGSQDSGQDDVTDSGIADASADAGPEVSVTFIIVELRTDLPLQGATVAVDLPGGERVEQVTGADGKVTIGGIQWSAGPISVTYHLDGYAVFSWLDLDQAWTAAATMIDGAVALHTWEIPPLPSVTVSGTLTGLVDPAHDVRVNVPASPVASEWDGNSVSSYFVTVPSGLPFHLQGLEMDFPTALPSGQGYTQSIYRVMQKDFPATTVDLTAEVLDFAAFEVPTYTGDISVAVPARTTSPVRSYNYAICGVADAPLYGPDWAYFWYFHGWPSNLDISADGNSIEASMIWTEPSWVARPRTWCEATGAGWSSFSTMDGYPQPGGLDPMLDVAELAGALSIPMHDPFAWDIFDAGVSVSLWVSGVNGFAWVAHAPDDATSATLPELPSSADAVTLFGTDTGALQAFVSVSEWEVPYEVYKRGAWRRISLVQ